MKHAQMGSISTATMRTADLIPAFVDELEYHAKRNKNKSHLAIVKAINRKINKLGDSYYKTDDADFDLNETLFDALNEYALPYFYFGAHPGDGSDYGFWLTEDLEEVFDGLKANDLSKVPDDYKGEVLDINDHGNMTLYLADKGKLTEVWAVV